MKFAIILFFITFSVLGTEPTYSCKIKNVKKLKRLPVLDDYIEHRKKGVFCDMEFEDVDILIFELSLDVKWPEGKTSFPIKFSTLNIVDDRDETLQHIGEYKKETVYRSSSINYSRGTVDKRVRKEKIKQSIIRLAYKLPRDSKSLSCLLSGEKQKILIPKKYSRVSDRPGVKVPLVV